jgi:hypothetical protein
MATILIPNGPQLVRGGIPTFRDHFNGASPWAPSIRELADFLNMLGARRGRCLFSKYCVTWYTTADTTDRPTLRFACHTGPFATRVRIAMVTYPATSRSSGGDSKAYWVMETGITGSGTTTTGSNTYQTKIYTAHAADNFDYVVQEFTVSSDSDYRFVLHQLNAYSVVSVEAYELSRSTLDTTTDTNVIDTRQIAAGLPITTVTTNKIYALADKLWKRGGHPLFVWNMDGASALAKTNTSAANFIDGTTTPTSTTLGFPINIPFSGSLDSSDVGIVFWTNAYVSAGTGTITLRDQAGTVMATISVTATSATWQSTTGNLADFAGTTPTTRLEVYASVTAANTLNIHALGAFMHVA